MASPNTVFQVSDAQATSLVKYCKATMEEQNHSWQLRTMLQDIDLAYMREKNYGTEHRRAAAANAYGDKSRIQDVEVPIVMPQVEAGVTFFCNVFLRGYPIFGVVSNKENIDEAMQMDTLMAEHGIRGGWAQQLNLFFRNGLKYNLSPIEVTWGEETVFSAETDLATAKAKLKEIIWAGNNIKTLDPYNTFWDTSVTPSEVHKHGEYAGYTELMSRTRLKTFLNNMPTKIIGNVKKALESGNGGAVRFYTPVLNVKSIYPRTGSFATDSGSRDWLAWARDDVEQRIKYKNSYEVTILYARIIPQDFGLAVPGRNIPQIWKFIIINDSVLVLAERQSNAHNYLPILISQPLADNLSYQTKGFAENVIPLQQTSSAILNASMHARRRAVYDRLAYDPSKVSITDINNMNPISRIPMKAAAYGTNIGEAFHQFPFRDDQSAGALQQVQLLSSFAEMTNGINRAQQGQFTKGNRTQHEYQDVMSRGDDRLTTIAQVIEAQTFTPLKEMLKLNILQYATEQELFNRDQNTSVTIKPEDLRAKSLEFKVSDGLLPTDKLISAETLQVALQVFGSSPQLQQEFDTVSFFIYYLKSQGARGLDDFKFTPEQIQQRMAQQQQAMQQQQNPQTQGVK